MREQNLEAGHLVVGDGIMQGRQAGHVADVSQPAQWRDGLREGGNSHGWGGGASQRKGPSESLISVKM